ncbi:MAG: hypothetical protein QOG74_3292 [Alphaproteobacteria bacterium]|jgi:hypothetical protein|nr:hypothetical protein [Alphaproteobacteria bacterium]
MEVSHIVRWSAVAALVAATCAAAEADTLKIVEVAAPAINCVFSPLCSIIPTDSTAPIPLNITAGSPFLQSRTFVGLGGTAGAGRTSYQYRVDLRSAVGNVDCLLGLVVNFGPIIKLPYRPGLVGDVYVITQGGLGTVGIKSAEQDGDVITFTFAKPMCVGESTFFFGLTSNRLPHGIAAGMFGFGNPPFVSVNARAPNF